MRLVVVCALVLSLASCATQDPYRQASVSGAPCLLPAATAGADETAVWERSEGPCATSWAVRVDGPGAHGINFVEIDEQGVLADRRAMEDALAFASAPTPPDRSAYVVVFIHGWHHNASADDGNVQGFHRALHAVSLWHPQHEVRGIYVGWRGDSLAVPGLRYATFWDRKNTSDEVGRGSLLEFLLRLERAAKPASDSKNRLVLIGHSFGASVAFNALAHVHMQRFLDGVHSSATGSRFRGYGDLVVLVNPAIEAMRYMPLQSALDYYTDPNSSAKVRADFSQEPVPRLVILSSEGDWATRKSFRAARLVSTALEAHQHISAQRSPDEDGKYSEWTMDQVTVGNFMQFQTHWPLQLTTEANGPPRSCRQLDAQAVRELTAFETATPDTVGGPTFPDSNIRLARRMVGAKGSPYIVAAVSTDIVSGHNDIGNVNLICWINQLADPLEASPTSGVKP